MESAQTLEILLLQRLNRYIFASAVFAMQISLLAGLAYFLVQTVYILLESQNFGDTGLTLSISFYIVAYSFLTSYLSFLASIGVKKFLGLTPPVPEKYLYLAVAALPINIYIAISDVRFLGLHFLIPFISLIVIYVGSRIYTMTWLKIQRLEVLEAKD